jgi:acyl transferase domain-containing protein
VIRDRLSQRRHRRQGFAPSVDGQAQWQREALAGSPVDAASVSYTSSIGTGTPVGDPIEFALGADPGFTGGVSQLRCIT